MGDEIFFFVEKSQHYEKILKLVLNLYFAIFRKVFLYFKTILKVLKLFFQGEKNIDKLRRESHYVIASR